jgi:hypothetical protein
LALGPYLARELEAFLPALEAFFALDAFARGFVEVRALVRLRAEAAFFAVALLREDFAEGFRVVFRAVELARDFDAADFFAFARGDFFAFRDVVPFAGMRRLLVCFSSTNSI